MSDVIDEILRREGSTYTNRSADRGGPTKYGITQATLSQARDRDVSPAEVAALTEAEARSIYEAMFIKDPGFSGIVNEKLRNFVVDAGVNHGVGRAAKWIQAAAGVVADGKIGPVSLAAINGKPAGDLYRSFFIERLKFYGQIVHGDPRQAANLNGWINRMCEFL